MVNVSNGQELPNPLVVSLWSSDLIAQQQLAVDGSLPPETLVLASGHLTPQVSSSLLAAPFLAQPPGAGEGAGPWLFSPTLPSLQLISFSRMTLNIISIR